MFSASRISATVLNLGESTPLDSEESEASFTQEKDFSAEKAAPAATKSWLSSGTIISSSLSFSVTINLWRSWSKKWSGPPKKATFPRIGFPQARPEIV